MKMNHVIRVLQFTLLVLCGSAISAVLGPVVASAAAEFAITVPVTDFTIAVPVRLFNLMSSVTAGEVACSVGTSLDEIGRGTASFSIDTASGGFQSDVVVRFNALPGKNSADAKYYSCNLSLKSNLGWLQFQYLRPIAKPGTPFTIFVKGDLP